jgi:hypothetical protein
MSATDTDKIARAREQAKAQYDSIVEMVDKLRAADDDDAYLDMAKALAEAEGFTVLPNDEDGFCWAKGDAFEADDTSYPDEDAAWFACCEDNGLRPDADEARREIEEDALSVQVRSGWCSPGERMEADEYEVLLCTGGPAVRIVGDVCNGSPSSARLECQDWFMPWTEAMRGVDEDVLLAYVGCFWFGE